MSLRKALEMLVDMKEEEVHGDEHGWGYPWNGPREKAQAKIDAIRAELSASTDD